MRLAKHDGLFQTAHLRAQRASLKAGELAQAWNSIPKESLYEIRPQVNRDGNGEIRAVRKQLIPPEFALQLGEILYQLRAALDSCVYDAAIIQSGNNPPPNKHQLEFPICRTLDGWPPQCKRRLKPLSGAVIRVIESVQPYQAHPMVLDTKEKAVNLNDVVGALHEWARIDRHRTLHTVGNRTAQIKPRFKLPNGVRLECVKVFDLPVMGDDNLIASFRLSGWSPGMKAQFNPDLAIQISLDERPLPAGVGTTLAEHLSILGMGTIRIVQMMERAARGR